MAEPHVRRSPSHSPGQQRPTVVPAQVPPPTQRDRSWFSPIFVLCPARSNSSVVVAMLGQHPDLCGFPELALFRRETLGDMLTDPPGWKGPPTRLRLAGLYRALAQLHRGVQTSTTVAEAARWVDARRAWRPGDVLDHLLRLASPRAGVEKSPEVTSRDEYFERLVAAYPRARYVHLTRHPTTAVASMHAVWHDKGYWTVPPELFHHFCAGIWYFQHLRIHRFIGGLPPDRAVRVRSEDVLNAPETTLRQICKRLGLQAGDDQIAAMLSPEDSPYARLGPRGAMGGADVGFLRSPARRESPLPTDLAFPHEWRIEPWLHLCTMTLAHEFGYGADH